MKWLTWQVKEFLEFQERLEKSLQRVLMERESTRLEIVIESGNPSQLDTYIGDLSESELLYDGALRFILHLRSGVALTEISLAPWFTIFKMSRAIRDLTIAISRLCLTAIPEAQARSRSSRVRFRSLM